MENYEEHLGLARNIFEQANMEWHPECLSPPVIHEFGPQVVVVQMYDGGPAEVDTIPIVGFYIPHDGQCTVAVNHMNGLATLDNADLMFNQEDQPSG